MKQRRGAVEANDEVPARKRYLQFAETRQRCACTEDDLFVAGGESQLTGLVIARQWVVEGGDLVSGYVELLPETMLLTRNQAFVRVDCGILNGKEHRFTPPQEVFLGGLYFSEESVLKFAADRTVAEQPAAPGPRAERNQERTIAALSMLLADKLPDQFRKPDGKPNADKIGEQVYSLLDAKGLADSGLSVRAIQERILKAFKVLAI